jgi:hypothetical protein
MLLARPKLSDAFGEGRAPRLGVRGLPTAATVAASAIILETLRPYLGFALKEEDASGEDCSSRDRLSGELCELATELARGEVSEEGSPRDATGGVRRVKLSGGLAVSSAADASCINSVRFRPDFKWLRLAGLDSGEDGRSFSRGCWVAALGRGFVPRAGCNFE